MCEVKAMGAVETNGGLGDGGAAAAEAVAAAGAASQRLTRAVQWAHCIGATWVTYRKGRIGPSVKTGAKPPCFPSL